MTHVPVVDVLQGKHAVGTTLTVKGWIRTRRDSKAGISFLAIHDGSCFAPVQAVVPNTLSNYENDVLRLTTSCSVEVTGVIQASAGTGQQFEILADSVTVLGFVEDPDTYPMAPKRHSVEYLREHAHLRVRTNMMGAVTRVRNCIAQAIHRFFHDEGFMWIATPLITASDCEGAGEMFRVSTLDMENLPRTDKGAIDYNQDFFGKEAFLTVSGQLNLETYACAMSKVYTFGPTFRAENSNTSRHLAEFWMLEPEVAFADLNDVAGLAEAMLKYAFKAVLAERADDMKFFAERVDKDAISRLERFIDADFAQVDYTDAVSILEKCGKQFENPVYWGVDLSSEHERYLAEEHFKAPVVVLRDVQARAGVDVRRRVFNQRCGGQAPLLHGLGIQKRFQGGAGLALGQHTIDLVRLAQAARRSHPSQHLAAGVVQHQHRAVFDVVPLQLTQMALQALQRYPLHIGAQRGGDAAGQGLPLRPLRQHAPRPMRGHAAAGWPQAGA